MLEYLAQDVSTGMCVSFNPLRINGIAAPCIMRSSSKEGPKAGECPESLNVSTSSILVITWT